ncbi:hypothetical protein DPEC_G00357330 [Dallia pectoralis]|uniref:Uncharacterized protein n=1 Tax=Dallia pectoralis TaxID=75939 RepID=A0ACC2F013_DALPE|nr:hypothetical protein DPEC_G00357330 [Dallia pectoralis]
MIERTNIYFFDRTMDSMEARFGYLRQRDTSVDMLRVKMSRRRSRSQKENRDQALNIRRQLDKVPELDCSLQDMSVAGNVAMQEKPSNAKKAKDAAVEERVKKLAQYKEKKALVKEKERRAKEKGVFRVGLYRPQPVTFPPQVPAATTKARTTTAAQPQSARVTRSTVRQQAPKAPQPIHSDSVSKKGPVLVNPAPVRSTRNTRIAIVEPSVSAPVTRSGNKPQAFVTPVVRNKSTTSNTKQTAAPPAGRGRNTSGNVANNKQAKVKVEKAIKETKAASPLPSNTKKDDKMEDHTQANPLVPPAPITEVDKMEGLPQANPVVPLPPVRSSFAPRDFVFQAPAGLSSFKPTPLTPHSADSFFKPSFTLPPVPVWPTDLVTWFTSASPVKSVPPAPRSPAPQCPPSPQEQAHDLPYFRSVVVSEIERLTGFCQLWELRVDDSSIPEEMRDRMRTAVGQARLLMKERFGQFTGLMDDCELGRGEKIVTCTDLQGFWDMVYYQVEDVNKKFGALEEAESKGWPEERVPPPRQRKVVKKPPAAPVAKPAGGAGAKSRLAAIKAAIKAKQQAAESERAALTAGSDTVVEVPAADPQTGCQTLEAPVVFQGGFFQVESPAKQTGSLRRSTRVAALTSGASPCSVPKFFTPRRTRQSNEACSSPITRLTPACTSLTPACSKLSLSPPRLSDARLLHTPRPDPECCTSSSLHNSPASATPVKHAPMGTESNGPNNQSEHVTGQNDQPEQESMQEDVACDQSQLVTEPAVCPEPFSQSPSRTQRLPNDEQQQEAISRSVATRPSLLPSSPPAVQVSLINSPDSKVPVTMTPDTSITEGLPGLDFELYLRPTARGSLSPREPSVAEEMWSPSVVDVDMESPVASSGEPHQNDVSTSPTAVSNLAQMFIPRATKPLNSDLLLFTPDPMDRVRQSMCPSDLMSFTPPSSQ